MKRFFLSHPPGEQEDSLVLRGEDYHYLCRVRRLTPGRSLTARDGEGRLYDLTMTSLDESSCRFSIDARRDGSEPGQWKITLFQCLPKGRKMDLIVRQAVEAGVSRIVPLESDHSLVKLPSSKEKEAKRERWYRIVREAVQQSGTPLEVALEPPAPFSALEAFTREGGTGLFCHQDKRPGAPGLRVILGESEPEIPLGLVIGPEGGLSLGEVDNLEKWGYHSVYFGENVLRTETAALYGTAAVKTVLRELI